LFDALKARPIARSSSVPWPRGAARGGGGGTRLRLRTAGSARRTAGDEPSRGIRPAR
jgi:hypothetical protein